MNLRIRELVKLITSLRIIGKFRPIDFSTVKTDARIDLQDMFFASRGGVNLITVTCLEIHNLGFSRLVCFDWIAAIFVCKSERNLGRVSKLPRSGRGEGRGGGGLVRLHWGAWKIDTLPRFRSLLQTKMAAVQSKHAIPRKNRGLWTVYS